MKSITTIKLFIIITLLSVTFQVRTKKSESLLEFFNNFFSEDTSEETERLESQFFKYSRKTSNGTASNGTTATGNSSNGNSTDLLQGWLRISSPEFKNTNKFPPIVLPNGDEIVVRVDSNYFRINEAFDINAKDESNPTNPLNFYFRVDSNQMYYSKTKDDYNILGAIYYTELKKDEDSTRFCMDIKDNSAKTWLICAEDEKTRLKFFCGIKALLKDPTPYECSNGPKNATVDMSQLPVPTVIEDKVFQPIILIPLPSRSCNEKWNYMSNGNDWECTCKEGFEQSPIDLPDKNKVIVSPVTPLFQYEEIPAKSTITTIDGELKAQEYIKIKYFKNALRIFHSNLGKIVTLDGAVYIAEEIVFHTPSEHTIEGKRYDMEMQVIHYGQSKGDISKQVVLSFLFERKPGVYNRFIDDVDFFSLPNPLTKERDITNNLFIPKVFYSSTDSEIPVMKPFSFYTYQGSLTFPPCTERTIHYVAATPISIGSAPLQLIREAIKLPDMTNEQTGDIMLNADDPSNYRDTQQLNDRQVFYFDHSKYCGPEVQNTKKEAKPAGHYEKLKRQVTEYFYVNGADPSGIPNSFVVSETEAKGVS